MKLSLTQVLHTLREQSLKRAQAVALRVHALGEGVPEMHLVLEEQPAGRATRRRHRLHTLLICLAVTAAGVAVVRLLHVGVAVRRARRGGVALVVEDDIVRGRRHVTCAPITFRI